MDRAATFAQEPAAPVAAHREHLAHDRGRDLVGALASHVEPGRPVDAIQVGGDLDIVGAEYVLETGTVDFFDGAQELGR